MDRHYWFHSRFNPRLRTGGDSGRRLCRSAWARFNPRLRTGGDSHIKRQHTEDSLFQSTPPHGRRPGDIPVLALAHEFQSTPPHGRRQERGLVKRYEVDGFQSTPPHGRRPGHDHRDLAYKRVSIHASAREATGRQAVKIVHHPVSIHASAREATRLRHRAPTPWRVSIHASAREATHDATLAPHWFPVSIHASAREATQLRLDPTRCSQSFNPRLRTGGDRHMEAA